jgi:hypothetical protein
MYKNRAPLWLLVAILVAVCGLVPASAQESDITDANGWFEALNMAKRAIYAQLIFSALGIVVVYVFVGQIWREVFVVLLLLGFQCFNQPRLLSEPLKVFSEAWSKVLNHTADDKIVIFFFGWMLIVVFSALLAGNVWSAALQRHENQGRPA